MHFTRAFVVFSIGAESYSTGLLAHVTSTISLLKDSILYTSYHLVLINF
ncbi:hypothetical protein J2S10_002473 [Neobacillus ginsengisoli]|uniref:Uncharacterized protein n=1 Tax=Neobacillus ginsengisoli TaxID=904295 RepID=A0ABT9XUR2_9BACI|nr:hypothetical protein [Neobacillus ginsengisoli]